MNKPITPDDMIAQKETNLSIYLPVWNNLIIQNWDGNKSIIYLDEIITSLIEYFPNLKKQTIFKHNILDVEDIYRKVGWDVIYDKPAYNEDYKTHFIFKKKR